MPRLFVMTTLVDLANIWTLSLTSRFVVECHSYIIILMCGLLVLCLCCGIAVVCPVSPYCLSL